MNFKNIHIGELILKCVREADIETDRICNFFNCKEKEIELMYQAEDLYPEIIMKWCKLLEYDFFRIYSQHLILYAPAIKKQFGKSKEASHTIPLFRKSLYTVEVIQFILELVQTGQKTKSQIMHEYNIPKTTLYKWIQKYSPPK